jgi:Xaa-Pro aminopeptidase
MIYCLRRHGLILLILTALALHGALAQPAGRYGHYDVYDTDLLPMSEYADRRAAVLEQLNAGAAMLVTAADHAVRSNDVNYEFRQRNSFLYLTGVTETDAALLLTRDPVDVDGRQVREILFVADRDPMHETWLGIRMGPDVASEVTRIRTVLSTKRLRGVLDSMLPSTSVMYYDAWMRSDRIADPLSGDTTIPWKPIANAFTDRYPGIEVRNAASIIDPMRLIKSQAEINMLRRAVEISCEAHRQTIRSAKVGMAEYELEAIMEYHFMRQGAESPGYPSIVGSGPNTCILHYETSRRTTRPGELVLMDCGAELHGYSADVTRTFPINGSFSQEQRTLYDIVLKASDAGITECRAGNKFWDPHMTARQIIGEELVRLGILDDAKNTMRYFMHGTSHLLGLDVHDVGRALELRPGMVLTVEPGIYIPEGSPCDPKWWNIGIRIEDDIVVTEGDPINLSESLVRTADEVEALMREGS